MNSGRVILIGIPLLVNSDVCETKLVVNKLEHFVVVVCNITLRCCRASAYKCLDRFLFVELLENHLLCSTDADIRCNQEV